MQPLKLNDHKYIKGRYITPFNQIGQPLADEESWVYGRLPEYLWIALVFDYYGRTDALNRLLLLVDSVKERIGELRTLRLSDIFSLNEDSQRLFYETLTEYIDINVMEPLTVVFSLSRHRLFVEYFFKGASYEGRIKKIKHVLKESMHHQSYNATDIRYIVLVYWYKRVNVHVRKETIDLLNQYVKENHSSEKMREIRPIVRSNEMLILKWEKINMDYLYEFWQEVSELTECELYMVCYKKEDRDLKQYLNTLHDILLYFAEVYENICPLEKKMKILIGIFTYSYKRFKEGVDHDLFSSISGRSIVRVIIEDYIMMKYLCLLEKDKANVWEEYEIYGIGEYKLVLERSRELSTDLKSPHFDEKYIEAIVNEYKNEDFINIDLRYFNNDNIRKKAEKVNEKDLYGLLYDYDSSYEHGLWGAIRESSFLKCDNPAHQYHCVPDCEDSIVMKSTADDCVEVLNRTILFLDEIYGIPEMLKNEAIEFGKQFTIE